MPPDKKREILDAAAACFTRFGYEKTTMDDVGGMVGMNKVSLYYYFENKEALFKEMILRESREYTDRMQARTGGITNARGMILAWIDAGLRYSQDSGILHQLSMETLKRLSPLMAEIKEAWFADGVSFVASRVKTGISRGELKKCDTARVAESIVKIVFSFKKAAYEKSAANQGAGIDIDGLIKEVVYTVGLLLDGLRPSEKKQRE